MSPRDKQFEDWLNGKLDKSQSQHFENVVMNDEESTELGERMKTAKYVEYLADTSQERDVPEWDRTAGVEFEENHWWQWQGLPAVSMAFSCFAMALVLFNVQLTVDDNGVLLTFGSQHQEQNKLMQEKMQQQVAQMVDEKLSDYQQQQQLALANFTNELTTTQQQSNLQLATYILDTSRQERKEDISDFIQFVNAQRDDDVLEQRIRYQRLQDAIEYQAQFLNTNTTIQPANWVSEE